MIEASAKRITVAVEDTAVPTPTLRLVSKSGTSARRSTSDASLDPRLHLARGLCLTHYRRARRLVRQCR